LLVKNTEKSTSKATIYHHDIGDYLSREEKLKIISGFHSVSNTKMLWQTIQPNEHGDWLNQRDNLFESLIPINSENKFDSSTKSIFVVHSRGNETTRDAWVYNSSIGSLKLNMGRMVSFFNEQIEEFKKVKEKQSNIKPLNFIETDPSKISWSSSLIPHLEQGNKAVFEPQKIVNGHYRPFYKQNLYLGDKMIHRRGQMPEFFANTGKENFVICVSGIGVTKEFSAIITNTIPDLELIGKSQCFPLNYYEERQKSSPTLFDDANESEYIRRDGVSDFILERAHKMYGNRVSKEDIFYFVYGILHSPEYRTRFSNDLKKMLPRIPLVEEPNDFWKFSKSGRALAELHINYEKVAPYEGVTVKGAETGFYRVEKMRFSAKDRKDTILYNSKITIENIPEKAYEYIVNGKSAIEWIMERYQVTIHKESGIKNNPNHWADEVGNPSYILDLLLSTINLSLKTVEIVESLPKLKFE
ncbi:MAG: type ISP restriction/modification enzyme, partial [Bacteroidota bacterium]